MQAPATASAAASHDQQGGGAVRRRVRIAGIVQGVGFRPYVHALATELGLSGRVRNDSRGVLVEIEGRKERVAYFLERLPREAPPLATIEQVTARDIPATGEPGFAIVGSRRASVQRVLISPDTATCAACLDELFDPADRRFLYPFINCTHCGPRFTIVRDVPYDRQFTTMADFAMCAACAREYRDRRDRRFHAEPISCRDCGPQLRLVDRRGTRLDGDPIGVAVEHLRAGGVVAVKGLGGYHLAALAANASAVAALRGRKHREDKPFAVMVADLEAAQRLAEVDAAAAALLTSPQRPIVLVRRRPDTPLAPAVAPGNRCVGLVLPYTPVHHMLCRGLGAPYVLTSGNVSDEPLVYTDDDALQRLRGIADVFLCHDRAIQTRTDDSVMRPFRGGALPLRRARGYAPQPLSLPWNVARPILACGAELKSTFCLVKGRHALLSHHIGDLENFATLGAFTEGIEQWRRLFDVVPEVVAYDLHPEYLSTQYALDLGGVARIGVQHHHAHIAACLADNAEQGPAIGVAFDGLGYGTDGTLWGGEFLVVDLADFERVGCFEPLPMPGGTAAIQQPWRMAAAYLDAAYAGDLGGTLGVIERNRAAWPQIVAIARARFNSPLTSSVGRLFDAVAAILGIRDVITYEGQAAVELEQLADPSEWRAYRAGVTGAFPYRVRGTDLIRSVTDDLRRRVAPAVIAARFHNAVARAVVDVCTAVRARRGLSLVALSGGVFQNMLLLERTVSGLEECGFHVLTHSRVPANDGGISFGQAAVAAARTRRSARN